MNLTDLFTLMEPGVSDLHLLVGEPPVVRRGGTLVRTDRPPLTDATLTQLFAATLPERLHRSYFADRSAVVCSVVHEGRRFRLSAAWERGRPCAVVRAIPGSVPRLSELRIAEGPLAVLEKLVKTPKGLVIVTGAAGSGKTTLLASLVEEINATRAERIHTLEESIDYEFQNRASLITQQELGSDFTDFPSALRDLLWADPDVVMVSTLNSLESVALALSLADTGKLVIVQMGQPTTCEALLRLVQAFPESNRPEIQRQLSNSLVAVVAQQLIPAIGGGRVPALELLIAVPTVRQQVREGNFDLTPRIEAGASVGMQTMERALDALVAAGTITEELAQTRRPVSG